MRNVRISLCALLTSVVYPIDSRVILARCFLLVLSTICVSLSSSTVHGLGNKQLSTFEHGFAAFVLSVFGDVLQQRALSVIC